MFRPLLKTQLLKSLSDLVLHLEIETMAKKLGEEAKALRDLENDLYQKGYSLRLEMDKKQDLRSLEKLSKNYESYKKLLISYITQRYNLLNQLSPILILIEKDIFVASELRESDHIKVINDSYQWLKTDIPSVIEKCTPISLKDRTQSGSLWSSSNTITSIFTDDVESLSKKLGLASAQELANKFHLQFDIPAQQESKDQDNPNMQAENSVKLRAELTQKLKLFTKKIEPLTTCYMMRL